jgi:signal transduction histidine kinase
LIHDDRGVVIGYAGAVHDITGLRAAEARQKELERQLLHSQKLEALGTLAGGVAHDLNNTLTPILALTKLVQDDLPADSPLHEEMAVIRQAGGRARDLVKQILAFSRKQQIRKAEVAPGLMVAEALRLLRATLPPNLAIIEESGPTPVIRADAGQLQQVVVKFVTNAAQAIGDADGSIIVEVATLAPAEDAGDFVQIRIADTGCGMEQQVVDRIFEPFFTTKEVGEGTGLGLAVVHGIVSGDGGSIDVASRPGAGTTFTILLPILKAAVPPLEAAA